MATAQVELRTQGQAYLRVLDVWAVAATKAGVRRVVEFVEGILVIQERIHKDSILLTAFRSRDGALGRSCVCAVGWALSSTEAGLEAARVHAASLAGSTFAAPPAIHVYIRSQVATMRRHPGLFSDSLTGVGEATTLVRCQPAEARRLRAN